jgi:hypothetical protein
MTGHKDSPANCHKLRQAAFTEGLLSSCSEVVDVFCGGEGVEAISDNIPEVFDCPGGGLAYPSGEEGRRSYRRPWGVISMPAIFS